MSYITNVSGIVEPGEMVQIIGPAGYAYNGTLLEIGHDVVRIKTRELKARDISINPAHIVSISVPWVEA